MEMKKSATRCSEPLVSLALGIVFRESSAQVQLQAEVRCLVVAIRRVIGIRKLIRI